MRTSAYILLTCLLFFSCENKKEKSNIDVTNVAKEDSSVVVKREKSINSYAPVDVSPMDISYFPADYPKLKMSNSTTALPQARIIYSRPHLQSRKLFPDVLKYGEPWRLGANEATELDFYKEVIIQGKKIKAGRYILYCIPEQEKWTIVLNSNIDSWGLHADPSKDIARFIIPINLTTNSLEFFTIVFQPGAGGTDLLMAWDNVEARLPIQF